MLKFVCYLVVFLQCVVFDTNAGVAPFIKPCKPDDNKCLVSSAQAAVKILAAGIPALRTKTADPMKIDLVRSDDASLKLGFRNIDITGISQAKILSIERDTVKQTIKLDLATPLHANGQYDLKGKILVLEAVGDGDFIIETDKVIVHVLLKFKTIEKNGNKYYKMTGYDYTYDLVGNVNIKLDNLFGGNQQLAKPLNELLKTESKLLVRELGGSMLTKVVAEYVNVIKQLFLAVPVSEIEI